jgi:hypothetical protein
MSRPAPAGAISLALFTVTAGATEPNNKPHKRFRWEGSKQKAALGGTKIVDEDRQHCGPHHHRRCHYANARAEEGACGTGNESASSLASEKADYSFRRNRATHEREGQGYHRYNFHRAGIPQQFLTDDEFDRAVLRGSDYRLDLAPAFRGPCFPRSREVNHLAAHLALVGRDDEQHGVVQLAANAQ